MKEALASKRVSEGWRRYRNPKRKRGIALLTVKTGDMCLALAAELGDEVDCLNEYSAEESLADASGYERSAGLAALS